MVSFMGVWIRRRRRGRGKGRECWVRWRDGNQCVRRMWVSGCYALGREGGREVVFVMREGCFGVV